MTDLPPPPPTSRPSPASPVPFRNAPVDVDTLPRLTDSEFTPLDPRYRASSLAGLGLVGLIVAAGAAVVASTTDAASLAVIIGGAALVALFATGVLWSIELKRLGYLLRDHDVSFRSGLLTHRVATVPFSRVQHVSVRRGPVERVLGLATVDVSSAGPDISIPGLALDDAERVKQLVTERAGVDTEPPPT